MITIDKVNTNEALRYMGYKDNIDIENIKPLLNQCEKNLLSQANYRYCYKVFDIEKNYNKVKILNTDLVLEGNSIYSHLEECNKVILMACTLSENVDRLINKLNITDMTASLITDAMASALIEQLCNSVEEEIRQTLDLKYITWRFSPGYGDLPISVQNSFIKTINAHKLIGLTATNNNILLPRKSVTAIIGISDSPIPQKKRGCAICSMNKTCQFRKRGTHCGF